MSFREVETRLREIVEGLGADGALGANAQARACTIDRFRTTETPDPSTLDAPALDRACNVSLGSVSDLIPRNVHCNERQVRAVLEVRVSYAAAPALWEMVHGEPSDVDKQTAASSWVPRALDDAREIERALTWYELTGNDTTPTIERVAPLGDVITNDLGNGRGLMIRRFEVLLEDTQP